MSSVIIPVWARLNPFTIRRETLATRLREVPSFTALLNARYSPALWNTVSIQCEPSSLAALSGSWKNRRRR